MIHESSGGRQEPLSVQKALDPEVDAVVNVPAEIQADTTVLPGDQPTNAPTPPVHEKGDWERFSDGEGPYPWHLV